MGEQVLSGGEDLLTALIAGTSSAVVSSTLTYPLDFIKTQQQLNNVSAATKYKIPGNYPGSMAQMFKGCSALVLGNIVKNSTRLVSYKWSTKFMAMDPDSNSAHETRTTAPRLLIAGMMSGFIETLWIVPFENVKIHMIQNMSLRNELERCAKDHITMDITGSTHKKHTGFANIFQKQYISPHAYFTSELVAQFKGKTATMKVHNKARHLQDSLKVKYNNNASLSFLGTCKEIYTLKGIKGFTHGSAITILRQMYVSGAWISTYNFARQLLDPQNKSTEQNWFANKHSAVQSMGLHLVSSLAVITLSQPIDVLKTHMQSKNGKTAYKDSLSTAYRLLMEHGWKSFFRGGIPRGLKVIVSGGLTATVYSYVEQFTEFAGTEKVFC